MQYPSGLGKEKMPSILILILVSIGFFLFTIPIIYLAATMEATLIFALAAPVPLILILTIKYPKLWIYLVVASMVFYLRPSDGLTANEIILGVYYIFSIVFWLFWQIFVKREPVIENIADWLVVFYFIFSLANIFVSISNDIGMFEFFREHAARYILLLYFPVRKYFNSTKSLNILMVILMLVVAYSAYTTINVYFGFSISHAEYAYQLLSTDRDSQTIIFSSFISALAFIIYQKNYWAKIIILPFLLMFFAGFILSFNRTMWLCAILECFIIFLLIEKRKKISFLIAVSLIITIGIIVVFSLFGDTANVWLGIVNKKFLSSGDSKDISLLSRYNEYAEALRQIISYPFSGIGVGTNIVFYNPYWNMTMETNYVHNGYICFALHFGLPLTIIYFFPFFFYFVRSVLMLIKNKCYEYKPLVICAMLGILTEFIGNMIGNYIMDRESPFIMLFSIAIISIAYNNFKQKENNNNISSEGAS